MNYRGRCECGNVHPGGVTPTMIARMKAYLHAHPDRQFAVDDDAGIVAVIISHLPGDPEVIARSPDLADLLNRIGAPAAEELS